MKHLQAIGLGMIWIILTTQGTTVDWFPDPVGWAIIALLGVPGLRRVEEILPLWRPLLTLAFVALAASIALWLPATTNFVDDEPSLGWALNLPGFAFFALLCHALASAAIPSDDPYSGSSASWLRLTEGGLIAVAVAPILVFGAGWDALGPYAATAAQIMLVALMILCFVYANRPWAGPPEERTHAPE